MFAPNKTENAPEKEKNKNGKPTGYGGTAPVGGTSGGGGMDQPRPVPKPKPEEPPPGPGTD